MNVKENEGFPRLGYMTEKTHIKCVQCCSTDWDPGLQTKGKMAGMAPAFISPCLQAADAKCPADSGSFCHGFPTVIDCNLKA